MRHINFSGSYFRKLPLFVSMTLLCLTFVPMQPVSAKRIAGIFGTNYTGNQAGIPPLQLCEADAKLMEDSLKAHGQYDSAYVLLGQQVTATNIRSVLQRIAGEAGKDDTVVLYFSGHGTFQRDTTAPNNLRNYLIMFDRPHLSDNELNQWLKGIRSSKTVWIFDACFSGGIVQKGRRGIGNVPVPEGSAGIVIENGQDDMYFRDKVLVSSSDANETSIEISGSINHGIFTYWFTQGLQNSNGDLNRDGVVTLLEAFEWSSKRVTEGARKFNHNQHPQITGNASGILVAGNLTPRPPVPEPEPVKPAPANNDQPKPPEVSPVKPPVTPSNPQNPVTPAEPAVVPVQSNRGNVKIITTILEYRQSGTTGTDPYAVLRRNKEELKSRNIVVTFSGKEYPVKIEWLDQSALKKQSGEDIPLGGFSHRQKGYKNRVAMIVAEGVPAGVHEIQIKADDYPLLKERLGVENKGKNQLFVVASLAGFGTIQGRVFDGNFEKPKAGQDVWMPVVVGTNQVHKMRTTSDGSFWFLNLPPSGNYMIKASFSEVLPLDNNKITVTSGGVTKLDIVLNAKK